MEQTITAIIIIALAVTAAVTKLFLFFRRSRKGSDCRPEGCANCPHYTAPGACDDPSKKHP